jgi:O-methyltransferase involved in polyketide biosynthesis
MLDTASPSLARAWDHLLGGGASFAADRSLARRLEDLHPGLRELLSASRAYAADQVGRIARSGVDQYLDLGAGLPTRPSTHEVARAACRGARVAYVDRDPAVTEHGRVLVPAGVRYVQGDLAEPEAILSSADLAGFLDLTRPVCLVATLALHVLDPGTARAVLTVLLRSVAPGSYLVVTLAPAKSGGLPESVWPDDATAADLAALFAGLDLLPPGIHEGRVLGAAGVKPTELKPAGQR